MTEDEKRNLVITEARKCIGIKESPSGSNNVIFNTEFYNREVRDGDKPGATYPWCGTSYCIIHLRAGLPIGNVGYLKGFASVPYALDNVAKWGTIVKNPKPGDAVIYYFGKKTPQHIGMFEKFLVDGKIQDLEGNTGHGNDANGGEFMEMGRPHTPDIIFIRPNCYDHDIKTIS